MERLQLVRDDAWLESNETEINERYLRFLDKLKQIDTDFGSLYKFSGAYHEMGFNYHQETSTFSYKEWAPNAHKLELVGDFNNWNPDGYELKRVEFGKWELDFPPNQYFDKNEWSRVKVRVHSSEGVYDRIPAYAKETFQDPETYDFSAIIRKSRSAYQWKNNSYRFDINQSPVIYECHIGMAQEKEKVGTYQEFRVNVLPKIAKLGYNTIQMMAVQEHPYYGSFGYHVSNFYATSSRFGSAQDLKALIDDAHDFGIAVVMDIVHSHSVKNWAEGLNFFDGSDHQYFHAGNRGEHPQWDSMLFDYGKTEVQRFLLSNIRYWLEEFKFDGFRFDGVTSMLYHHHGLDTFDNYDKYFKQGVEWDAVTYLQLANCLIKSINPNALSIAEDMSGMPGLCRKIKEGGIGFDYRLGMGIPDYWIKILKHLPDEQWNLGELWSMLNNRREKEKTISYAESHDQALVGDKTLAFWLMDKDMYDSMSIHTPSVIIDRGLALHKMIRLITATVGGEAYLNFMGNEFGHPEWIDFPTPVNNWSFKHCRRQWSLAEREDLKYKFLLNFDQALVHFIRQEGFLHSPKALLLNLDSQNHIIVFERYNKIFVFNFNPLQSFTDYEIPVNRAGTFNLVLDSDLTQFGGFDRVDTSTNYATIGKENEYKIKIYSPNRTVLVFDTK
jgi:1,4-alpha-glucan branching enzyme